MSKRDLDLLLDDIFECCKKIKDYTKDYSYEDFLNDNKTKDAVERNLTIIGEASSNIDSNFKSLNPQVQCREIKDFRNRIVHDYNVTNYEIVWEIITKYLDELEFQIEKLIKEIEKRQ
jgi:uncharacterized protein with HEPN domain